MSSDQMDKVREENAFFWQYFVAGAPCNLSQNINGDLGLVNGAPLELHSLTFSSGEEYGRLMELLNSQECPPHGSEIEVDEPLSVNVRVIPSLDGNKALSPTRERQMHHLRKLSLHHHLEVSDQHHGHENGPDVPPGTSLIQGDKCQEDNIVIPLTTHVCQGLRNSGDDNKFTYATHNPISPFAFAYVRNPFPFDLAFSMTIHKAQGRTLRRVVIDLTHHPNHYCRLNYAAVFVALSRVKCREHIRLLRHPLSPGQLFNWAETYKYLTSLRPDRDVAAFYHGYSNCCNNARHWDPNLALSYQDNDEDHHCNS